MDAPVHYSRHWRGNRMLFIHLFIYFFQWGTWNQATSSYSYTIWVCVGLDWNLRKCCARCSFFYQLEKQQRTTIPTRCCGVKQQHVGADVNAIRVLVTVLCAVNLTGQLWHVRFHRLIKIYIWRVYRLQRGKECCLYDLQPQQINNVSEVDGQMDRKIDQYMLCSCFKYSITP